MVHRATIKVSDPPKHISLFDDFGFILKYAIIFLSCVSRSKVRLYTHKDMANLIGILYIHIHIYNVVPPSYKLVYKPHEYCSYKYHKP